jgi:hypothetical protein
VDIDLSVGDEVIISNWSSPQDLLTIRTITGFRTGRRTVDVITRVNNDQSTEQVFPILDLNYGTVSAGCIREVVRSIEGLTIGMRVVPKVRMPGFLKSKPCSISAFIVDSEIPLVLCNNFHTFWLTEANRRLFNFSTSAETVSTQVFTPKIKPQLGDIFCSSSYEYDEFELLSYVIHNGRRNFRRVPNTGTSKWIKTTNDSYKFPNDAYRYSYYGIPSQRRKQETNAIPNLFSWFDDKQLTRDLL